MFLFLEGAAQHPFREEIDAFKKQDEINPPKSGSILFVGSSSFRFWKSMQKDFSAYDVINRGFGGSSLRDVIHYANEIVLPYNPRQVVVYCGENDLDGGTPVDTVVTHFKKLFSLIRNQNPEAHIVFVSIKPSPSRVKSTPAFVEANQRIKSFLTEERNTAYVDVFSLMVDKKGQPRKELFIQDMLHMNSKGYAIWTKAIQPHLLKP